MEGEKPFPRERNIVFSFLNPSRSKRMVLLKVKKVEEEKKRITSPFLSLSSPFYQVKVFLLSAPSVPFLPFFLTIRLLQKHQI